MTCSAGRSAPGGEDVDLAGGVLPVVVPTGLGGWHGEADLPHREHLVVARGEVHGGVRDPPVIHAPCFVDICEVTKQGFVDVLGQALAPGQHVATFRVQVGEEGRGPAAAVEPDPDPAGVADGPT